jgi:translation initiation factor IF-3
VRTSERASLPLRERHPFTQQYRRPVVACATVRRRPSLRTFEQGALAITPPPRPGGSSSGGFVSRDSRDQVRRTRINHMIRITPIRVVGPDNEQIGVIETSDALRRADELGLDLVEISPDARPPVCKIMDYGKFKYEMSKTEQKNRAASKSTEMKEVRLGRSVKIDPHDVQIRVDQARRFLMAGHKVLFTQRYRGREIAHRELGMQRLREISEKLADVSKIEQSARILGKAASMMLTPDKVKIDSIKRKLAKEEAAKKGISEEAALKAQEEAAKKALAEAEAQQLPDDDDDDEDDKD